jgi:polyphosphate glucokinase
MFHVQAVSTDILGIDIGGSGVKAALVDVIMGRLRAEVLTANTPPKATPDDLYAVIQGLMVQLDHSGPVGIGYPGVVINGVTLSAAHLNDCWIGYEALELLQMLTGESVALINDADAAGLAEMRFGAGKEFTRADSGTVLMLTLGTGIGSALFTGGRLYPNTEFGHLQYEGMELEDRAAAVVRTEKKLEWPAYADRLNWALRELERLVSPDLMIIGGGIVENFSRFGHMLQTRASLRPAELGNSAGVVGAALAVGQR